MERQKNEKEKCTSLPPKMNESCARACAHTRHISQWESYCMGMLWVWDSSPVSHPPSAPLTHHGIYPGVLTSLLQSVESQKY